MSIWLILRTPPPSRSSSHHARSGTPCPTCASMRAASNRSQYSRLVAVADALHLRPLRLRVCARRGGPGSVVRDAVLQQFLHRAVCAPEGCAKLCSVVRLSPFLSSPASAARSLLFPFSVLRCITCRVLLRCHLCTALVPCADCTKTAVLDIVGCAAMAVAGLCLSLSAGGPRRVP